MVSDVQKNKIRLCIQFCQSFLAAASSINRIAVILQMGRKQLGQDWFIINN